MRVLRGRFGDVRLWLRICLHLIRPHHISYDANMPLGQVQPLLGHVHVWDRCRFHAPYWYARCIAYEWCTARIAC